VSPVLTLAGVTAGYGGGDVLQGADLDCDAGSITCVVGPNGAGKSTVLRVVSGLLHPRAGEIRFGGRPIGGLPPEEVLRRGVAQVKGNHGCMNVAAQHRQRTADWVARRLNGGEPACAHGGGAVESRTTSRRGRLIVFATAGAPSICSNSRRAASTPSS
jgi:energy-coupling factor transporter ATP-binding protein EcfA2